MPAFMQAAGHPVRWRLLGELARSDRQVHELTALVDEQQSLLSYHLGRLRESDLVRTRRSAADGPDIHYRLALARCRDLLGAAGAALHPALRGATPPAPAPSPARVLFLCTGNSSRSQMAEALLRRRSGGAVAAFSAGSRPKPVNPDSVAVMAARGIDLTGAHPKHLDEFSGERFDRVITLCDRVPGGVPRIPRPAGGRALEHARPGRRTGRPAFERAADDVAERIEFLLHVLAAEPILEGS